MDRKLELFLKLFNCTLLDNKIYYHDEEVGIIKIEKIDIKKVNSKMDKGNLRFAYYTGDKRDICNILTLKLELPYISISSINTLNRKLEFNGIIRRNYTVHIEVDADECKIRFADDIFAFHLVNRKDRESTIQCCNMQVNQECLYYKSIYNKYSFAYHEELYHTNAINEKYSGPERSLVTYLLQDNVKDLIEDIRIQLNEIFEENFFEHIIDLFIPQEQLKLDFPFLITEEKYTKK